LCAYCESLFEHDLERLIYIQAASMFLEKYEETNLMNKVIAKMSSHWPKVLVKDENFFLNESDKIFSELPIDVKLFSSLFSKDKNGKDTLNRDEKDKIWVYFHKMIELSCQYIHYMRHPVPIYDENQKLVAGKYERAFLDQIEIKPCVKALKFKLKFTQ